jgi:hypothetical protein
MDRRCFLKYAGASAAVVVGASAIALEYLVGPRMGSLNQTATTGTTSTLDRTPPVISDFNWTPTRIQNGKVYDVRLSFDVQDAQSELGDTRVILEPSTPLNLGKAAFLPEDQTEYHPQPKAESSDSRSASFSQAIIGLKGGRTYKTHVTASDELGNWDAEVYDSAYVREFENIAQNLQISATALYYAAYTPGARTWDGTIGTPLLGQYDSADANVIDKHIDWASGFGIRNFLINFTGPYFPSTRIVKETYVNSPVANGMKFAFNYESHLRLKQVPYEAWWHIDVDDPSNLGTIKKDFEFLADTFFDDPHYLRIDNRPVVAFDRSRAFIGNLKSFWSELRKHMRSLGHDPYLIGDEVYWHYDWSATPSSASAVQRIKSYDAIICYNAYSPGEDYLLDDFENNVDRLFGEWSRVAWANGLGFIPSALPGIDLRKAPWGGPFKPLERSVDRFRKELNICKKYVDPKLQTLLIFFNEWNENSGVEPSVQDGFGYLQTLRDTLAGH